MGAQTETVFGWSEDEWKKIKKKHPNTYNNCKICGVRLVLSRCKEPVAQTDYFCDKHCPKHEWQSDYDWPTECEICGCLYVNYLEDLLQQNKISFIHR